MSILAKDSRGVSNIICHIAILVPNVTSRMMRTSTTALPSHHLHHLFGPKRHCTHFPT